MAGVRVLELEHSEVAVGKGLFVLSLDTELAWGSFDKGGLERHGPSYARVREVAGQLLDLCAAYRMPATWAAVGHLFLDSCSREGPDHHNDVLQPAYSWHPEGWLSHDPFSNAREAPLFYAPDLIERIRACPEPQEIATHTFTHAILGDPECTREVARSQVEAGVRVASERGIDARSLVFPRNGVGHLDVLCELGLRAFRGRARCWFSRLPAEWIATRGCHFADLALALPPPVYPRVECWRLAGAGGPWLYDLPASMFYAPCDGVWRDVPVGSRVRKALRGLRRAAERRALFHLWLHPFNLATSPRLLEGLERVFQFVDRQRAEGQLMPCSMGQAAEHLDHAGGEESA